ncbi:unnamed protein product [Gongylonema pulchrum]|uniref:ZZ-type domain-containing protein n=1 Tax=Gongylonema pulchrum TaxID=637853 RepID=A0A183E256_9BILA|nr:unnamed protein product [Gongylonema pulchrum]
MIDHNSVKRRRVFLASGCVKWRHRKNPAVYRRLCIKDISAVQTTLPLLTKDIVVEQFFGGDASSGKDRRRKAEAAQRAAYVIQCSFSNYEKVVRREREAFSNCSEAEAYFSHAFGIRQVCEACGFGILNAHFCCRACGLELCPFCFKRLREKGVVGRTFCRDLLLFF